MSLDHYNKIKVIGKGSYGEVWLAKHRKDKKQYVLKKLDLQSASKRERKAAELEAKLLSKLKHPNIVSYKDSFETGNGQLYIAMGFCEGGDLYSKLKDQRGNALDERQIVEWYVQISMALQYMHERHILHRDLKTQNIFLTKSNIIKLGDLGIARVLDSPSDMASTLIGTPYYMSPELFSNKPYNHKSDVWALGCCVYEMATLKHAFNAKDMNSLVYKILRGKMPSMPKKYSPELIQLIKAMLNQNPDKRPSVNRILRDPYIKKNIALFLEDTKKSRKPKSSAGRRNDRSRPGVDSTDNSRSSIDSSRSSVDSSRSAASQGKVSDKDRNRKVSVDSDLEPLQVGPELEAITEESEVEESRRSSNSGIRKARAQPEKSSPSYRSNSKPSSNTPNSHSKYSGGRDAKSYDKSSYQSNSRPVVDNSRPTSGGGVAARNNGNKFRQVQPASKQSESTPESSRSSKSARSTPLGSRSKDRSPANSPISYRTKEPSPSARGSKDSRSSKESRSSKDSRSNSRSPTPSSSSRELPPRPKGHSRARSDPLLPEMGRGSPSSSRRGSARSSVSSPSNSEESAISNLVSSGGDTISKARMTRRKNRRESEPTSEAEPIIISCDNHPLSPNNGAQPSNCSVFQEETPARRKYISEAYVSRQKCVPLKKVESEPILSSRDELSDNRSGKARRRPLPPPPNPSQSASAPRPSNAGVSVGKNRGVTESGYSSSSCSSLVSSSATESSSRPTSARQRRREQKTLETPRTNRSVDLINRRSLDLNSARSESQYKSADYSSAQSHAKQAPKQVAPSIEEEERKSNKNVDLDATDGLVDPIIGDPIVILEKTDKPKVQIHERHRQPSVGSSGSESSEDEEEVTARVEEKQKRHDKREVDNFISVLSTTLLVAGKADDEDDDEDENEVVPVPFTQPSRFLNGATYVKSPAKGPEIQIEPNTWEAEPEPEVTSPSADPKYAYPTASGHITISGGRTMTTTGRLWERITVLRKDCIRALGVEKLKRAYDILDNQDSESIERPLIQLLGQEDYELYAGKIYQLKFCEESAFGLS